MGAFLCTDKKNFQKGESINETSPFAQRADSFSGSSLQAPVPKYSLPDELALPVPPSIQVSRLEEEASKAQNLSTLEHERAQDFNRAASSERLAIGPPSLSPIQDMAANEKVGSGSQHAGKEVGSRSSTEAASSGRTAVGSSSEVKRSVAGDEDGEPGEQREAISGKQSSAEESSTQRAIRWRKGEIIGAGAFGRVYMGMDLDSGELIAVKQVLIMMNGTTKEKAQEYVKGLEEEVAVLKMLSHPNIVRYLGTEMDEDVLNIFLEFVPGGSIASLLNKFGCFTEKVIRSYTRQIMTGLDYLHGNHIMHRDIKGANILVDNKGCIKLADFGASKKLADLATISEGHKSMKGTPYWMAPEVIKQTGHGRQADIWSVACTVIEMATGKPPWSQFESQVSALFHIAQAQGPPTIPSSLSRDAQDFLLLCFQRDPRERPSASELLKHPFLSASFVPPEVIDGATDDIKKSRMEASLHAASEASVPALAMRDSSRQPLGQSAAAVTQARDAAHGTDAAGADLREEELSFGMGKVRGEERGRGAWQQSEQQPTRAAERAATSRGVDREAMVETSAEECSSFTLQSNFNPMEEPSLSDSVAFSHPSASCCTEDEVTGPYRGRDLQRGTRAEEEESTSMMMSAVDVSRYDKDSEVSSCFPPPAVIRDVNSSMFYEERGIDHGTEGLGFVAGQEDADDVDDDVTEEKIRGFLELKALELQRLQTPLFEELNSLRQTVDIASLRGAAVADSKLEGLGALQGNAAMKSGGTASSIAVMSSRGVAESAASGRMEFGLAAERPQLKEEWVDLREAKAEIDHTRDTVYGLQGAGSSGVGHDAPYAIGDDETTSMAGDVAFDMRAIGGQHGTRGANVDNVGASRDIFLPTHFALRQSGFHIEEQSLDTFMPSTRSNNMPSKKQLWEEELQRELATKREEKRKQMTRANIGGAMLSPRNQGLGSR